jgi:hypothetical protein
MGTVSPSTGTFGRALGKFTDSLTEEEKNDFSSSTLQDLYKAISNIQDQKPPKGRMRTLRRVQPFIEAMDQYGNVIETFLDGPSFMAVIWV